MVIAIRNGRIVGLNMPKEGCGTESEEDFLTKISSGTFRDGGHPVHLRLIGSFRLSERPYLYARYDELKWVNNAAEKYGIERDESFTNEFKELERIFKEAKKKVFEEYYRLKAMAIRAHEERLKKAEAEFLEANKVSEKCGNCPYCADVIDGDLYCDKYRKYLDSFCGDKVTLTGEHLMFASYGLKLSECIEAKKKALEEEKARYIEDASKFVFWYSIDDAISKEMRNY
jgi:hypothetical protein